MKIFITNCTGSLVKRIVHHAIERGHEVCVLCSGSPSKQKQCSGVEFVQGDLSDVSSFKHTMQSCDALIHSAGIEPIEHQHSLDAPNPASTQTIFQCAAQNGIQRTVFLIPCSVFGPTSEKPANEKWQNHLQPGYKPAPNTQRIYEIDQWIRGWNQNECGVMTVYSGVMYGPGIGVQNSFINRFMDRYIHNRLYGIPGKGTFRWTFSYIEDVAKGVILALENGKPGERYILGGEDATLLELVELLQSVTQLKKTRRRTPLFLLKMVEKIEQCKTRLFSSYAPEVTPEILNGFQHHWRYSSQKAIAELGYTRTPLKIGIIKTLESLHFNFPSERDMIL